MGASVPTRREVQIYSEKSKWVHYPCSFSFTGCFYNSLCFCCIICFVAGLGTNTWSALQKSVGTLPSTLRAGRSSSKCANLQYTFLLPEYLFTDQQHYDKIVNVFMLFSHWLALVRLMETPNYSWNFGWWQVQSCLLFLYYLRRGDNISFP